MTESQNIQRRMALLTLVPLLILTVCLEFFLLHGRFSDLDAGLIERGKLIARQMATNSEYGVFSNNQSFLSSIAAGVLREPDVRGLLVLDASSAVILKAGNVASAIQDWSNTIHIDQTRLHAQLPIKFNTDSIWIYQAIVPAQVLVDDFDLVTPARQIGAVVIEISRIDAENYKLKLLLVTLAGTALFLLMALYLVYLAGRSITIPTRELSEVVQQIAQGDLSARATFPTRISELSTLSHGLNEMADQLQHDRDILQQRIDHATVALREKKEDAERSSQDKSRFLAVASHDLRQPLHALGLYVSELRRQLTQTSQQHLVEQIERSVDALTTLLNALLDISKLDAGAVVPQMQPCNISVLIARVTSDYQMLASINNVHLVVRPCSGFVTSDPVLLERILMNLVSNAIRYCNPQGCVLIACRKRGNQLRIEVRDNGIGISHADQANIFREFFQVSKPQLDSSKGQGLGLAIVDRLVRLLGHGIELRSAPGKGSLFALQVPICSNTERLSLTGKFPAFAAYEHEGKESLPLAEKCVLVVDDDELVLTSTSAILSSWGADVSVASSLRDVQHLLVNHKRWDMIVSDYQLGGDETGFDVISAVRIKQASDVPAILISGDTSMELSQLASSAGHHLMYKPVKPAKLRSLAIFLLTETEDSSTGQ